MRQRLAVAGLGVAILFATGARAQEGLRDRDRTFAASAQIASDLRRSRIRFGSFYLLSQIQLSDIGYDQQYFVPTSEQSTGVTFGLRAPQRLYFVPNRKSVYSVEAVPEYSVFNGSSSGRYGFTMRGDAQYLFNHLYLDIFTTQSKRLQPFSGEIDRLATAKNKNIGLAGEIKYSSRTSVTMQAAYNSLTYPRDSSYQPAGIPVELLDRIEQKYRAALLHKTFPLTSLSLIGERSNYGFRYTAFKDAHRTFFGAGLNMDNHRDAFKAEIGRGRLDFIAPDQHDYSGILGNMSYSRHGTSAWTVGASVLRDLEFSILNRNDFYIIDRAQFLSEYPLTRKLVIRLGANGGIDRYQTLALAPNGQLLLRRDTMSFSFVGFTYVLRRLRGGLDVGYYTRDTNFDAVESRRGIRTVLHMSFTL